MEELIDLLNYYGREGCYHTMRNMAREAIRKHQNSTCVQYYAALPLLHLRHFTDFVKESKSLKFDPEVGLAINLALIYCSRTDIELLNEEEVKEIECQLNICRKKAGEKALLHAANFFLHLGRYTKAREYADRILKSYPDSPKGLAIRGWVELTSDNVNRTQIASEYFAKCQIYLNGNINSIFGQILCLKAKGDIAGALEVVNRLVLQIPNSLPPLIEKVKVYMAACKWEEAQEVIDVILGINSKCLAAYQLNAMCSLCGDGDFNKAASLLRTLYVEAETFEPFNAEYFSENARLFSKISIGNDAVIDETIRFSEKAVQLDQGNAMYLVQMGNQYLLKRRTKDAIKIFRSAMKTDEVSLIALIGLTRAHMIEGGSGLEQAFKNIKLLNEVHGAEASTEIMLMTTIMKRCNGQQKESQYLLNKAISKHLNAIEGMFVGSEYLALLDPDFLLNAACECLIVTPVPCFTTNFVEEICLISSPVLQSAIDALQHIVKACPGMKRAHLLLGKAQFMAGNIQTAVEIIEKVIEKVDANDSIAYLFLSQIYSETGSMEQASLCLESGLSYDFSLGQHLLYHLVSGRILRENGNLEASITTLNKGIDVCTVQEMTCSYKMLSLSDEVSLYLELAESYHIAGNENGAKKIIMDAYEKFKCTSEIGRITLSSASMTLKLKHTEEAITLLNSILPDDPYYVRSRQQLADFYISHMKDSEMYIACYKNILEWCGETCQSYLLYGNALMYIQEPDKAIEAYELVLCKEPSNAQAMYRMGYALIKAHHYGKAIGYLKEGEKNGDVIEMRITLAHLLLRMKQYERAERVLMKELEDTKGEKNLSYHLQILLLLAKVHVQLDKNESSVAMLREALEIQLHLLNRMEMEVKKLGVEQRDVANVCATIASLYVKMGNHIEALSFLKCGLCHVPDDVPTLEALSSLYMKLGDEEQCQSTCSTILNIDPHNKSAFIIIADLAFRRLDFDSAAFQLEQLLEHHHCYWQAYVKLIEVRRRAGRLDEVPLIVRGDSLSDSGIPAGLSYCRGIHSWYVRKPAAALHHFHYAKRDMEWALLSIRNMVEIYLYPDGNCLPGGVMQDSTKAVIGPTTDSEMLAAISNAKSLLSEQQKFCQNKEQHLQWRLLDLTTLLASREKQNVELALREFSVVAAAPDSRMDHVGVAVGLATAHILLRQASRARNHLKRVARNQWSPDDADNLERAWLLLADHYFHSGKNESAAEFLQRALQHNKSCIKAQELLGQVMEKAQAFNDAVKSYDNAWKMGMKANLTVGYKLAHTQMKAKHYAEAIDVSHEVLRLSPNESRVRKDILEKCRSMLRT